jgi:hypothetical protein
MGPGIFLIAILGCGDAGGPCRTVRLLDAPYPSRAGCLAASGDALAKYADAPYPTMVAQCLPAKQASSFRLGADEVLKPAAPALPSPPSLRMAARD